MKGPGDGERDELRPPLRRLQQPQPRHPPSPDPMEASVTTTAREALPMLTNRGPSTITAPPQVGLPHLGPVTLWSGRLPRAHLREQVQAITTNRRAAPGAHKGPPTITSRGGGLRAGLAGLRTRASISRL
eukprot:TRINITY_DN1759_c0_g2_i1.p3 TRINITY_DN1759_c0_g2~~TRINITY_DN1759_c0_g2_i1.p3  ORF type:complete len:130 (-),score=1.93 TRINITY_DN1759_c0_g2_i1:532-921(-)